VDAARALGPERTRDELIPFLTGIFFDKALFAVEEPILTTFLTSKECVDDEDEVIVVIAEELGERVVIFALCPPARSNIPK